MNVIFMDTFQVSIEKLTNIQRLILLYKTINIVLQMCEHYGKLL